MSNLINNICIFCGSSFGESSSYKEKAEALGKHMAQENITLVFGGSNLGLMGIIADAVLNSSGKAIGVIPEYLYNKGIAHLGLSELNVVKNMNDRKAMMIELSDAFIAMPGGYGTLDEISEVLSLNQLNMINKPCALFNINGFFDNYLKQLDHAVLEKLLHPEHRNMLITDNDEKNLIDRIKNHEKVKIGKWY